MHHHYMHHHLRGRAPAPPYPDSDVFHDDKLRLQHHHYHDNADDHGPAEAADGDADGGFDVDV